MKILLPLLVAQRLDSELRRAGRQEIGGLLLGEHIQDDIFRIAEATVQHSGGTSAHFVRDPSQHAAQLKEFFSRTRDYERFNYLGEWHSHPSFEPEPSITDLMTMQAIVNDSGVGANFLILVIVKRRRFRGMQFSGVGVRRNGIAFHITLQSEDGEDRRSSYSVARKFFRR